MLQAPKITTFNGATATIFSGTLQYYVSALTPIVGPGSVAFVPTPTPLFIGPTLSVVPVVSADRRYVRMSMTPQFNSLNGFTTIQVPAAVGGSGLGGGSATINATLQLPNTTTSVLTTTVTVPDGGTVLLGGLKTMNEQRTEYGVPILSKTPLLDLSVPERWYRASYHQLDADGHAPNHHPGGGRGETGDPAVSRPLILAGSKRAGRNWKLFWKSKRAAGVIPAAFFVPVLYCWMIARSSTKTKPALYPAV